MSEQGMGTMKRVFHLVRIFESTTNKISTVSMSLVPKGGIWKLYMRYRKVDIQ